MVQDLLVPRRRKGPGRTRFSFWDRHGYGGKRAMIESIRQFFMANMAEPDVEGGDNLTGDLRLAACALLLELAYADDNFSEGERIHLKDAVRRQFGLDEEQAGELIDLAEGQRSDAVDLWTFTNLVAEHYSLGQKMVLAEAMWGLVYSDGELASREDYLMRKISGLLRLEPGYLAEAKKRVEEHQSSEENPLTKAD